MMRHSDTALYPIQFNLAAVCSICYNQDCSLGALEDKLIKFKCAQLCSVIVKIVINFL